MIEFREIYLSFNGNSVINNLSLKIYEGDKVVIYGKSGSGKSSLLSLALGFLKPDEGQVYFDGLPVDEKTAWNVRRKIAYIDQDVSLGSGRVSGLFEFAGSLKANAHLDFNHSEELMSYFELEPDILQKSIQELSGGERQRISIIIAVLLNRNIFFLDEITSSLDRHLKNKVADYFLDRENVTSLIISHDPVWTESPSVRIFDFEEKTWQQ